MLYKMHKIQYKIYKIFTKTAVNMRIYIDNVLFCTI